MIKWSDIGTTNEQLLGEKKLYAKFKIDISKTKRLVRVYTDGRTDGYGKINSAHHADHLCI